MADVAAETKKPSHKAGDVVKLIDEGHPKFADLNGENEHHEPRDGTCTVEYTKVVTDELTGAKSVVCSCVSADGKHSFDAKEDQLTGTPKPGQAGPSRASLVSKPPKAKEPANPVVKKAVGK